MVLSFKYDHLIGHVFFFFFFLRNLCFSNVFLGLAYRSFRILGRNSQLTTCGAAFSATVCDDLGKHGENMGANIGKTR